MPDRASQLRELLAEGDSGLKPDLLGALPIPWRFRQAPGIGYDLSDPALVTAVKAALLLGQPLILAGEPGVGKTTLAHALAERLTLHLHDPLQVKSTTNGLDLFYYFDEVARFRDASRAGGEQAGTGLRDYVRLSSLGRAILWSAGDDAEVLVGSVPAGQILPGGGNRKRLALGELFPDEFNRAGLEGREPILAGGASTRSMVLIDELDKAPRDAPNDILGELEALKFRIAELDLEICARPEHLPVILITSNSERSFPDAFLRRCVFHWIDYPTPERLMRIAATRCDPELGLKPTDAIIASAVDWFIEIRGGVENKKPSTAELISFLTALLGFGLPRDAPIDRSNPVVARALGILVKTQIDAEAVAPAVAAAAEG